MKFYVKPKKPESNDELMHYGRPGQKSGVHKFGRWQRQAKYANGQPDPDAKDNVDPERSRNALKKQIKQLKKKSGARVDDFVDGIRKISKSEEFRALAKQLGDSAQDIYNKSALLPSKKKTTTRLNNIAYDIVDSIGLIDLDTFTDEEISKATYVLIDEAVKQALKNMPSDDMRDDMKQYLDTDVLLYGKSRPDLTWNKRRPNPTEDEEDELRVMELDDVREKRSLTAKEEREYGDLQRKIGDKYSQESQKRRDAAVESIGKTKASGSWSLDRQRALRDVRTELYENKPKALNELDRAINNDKWSLDFLEAIQNSKISNDGDAQAMAIEYAYYLLDPEDYMKNRELPYA